MKDATTETNTVPVEIAEQLARPCTRCFWFCQYKTGAEVEQRCAHPDHGGTPDPVFGRMEAVASASAMRAASGACGPKARLMTPNGLPYPRSSIESIAGIM